MDNSTLVVVIKDIAQYIGYIMVITGFCATCSKKFRGKIISGVMRKQKEDKIDIGLTELNKAIKEFQGALEEQTKIQKSYNKVYESTMLELTRHNLNQLWHIYRTSDTITEYDHKAFIETYNCYVALKGKSYMEEIYELMKNKRVVAIKDEE